MFKNGKRGVWAGIAAAVMFFAGAVTVFAGTAVSTVNMRFVNQYDGEDGTLLAPAITYGGGGFSESDVSWSKDLEKWKPGSKVTASITLSPDEGRTFLDSYTTGTDSRRISVSGADFLSAKRDEDGNLIVKANYYPVVQLGTTERAGWSDATKTKAVWKKVPFASAYQLRLYSGEDTYVRTLTLEGTSVDLSEYITKQTNYYYEVSATSKDSSDAKYMKNGEYVTSTDNLIEDIGDVGGRWQQTRDGYRYVDQQGAEAANGWRYILGYWYYFNADGYAVTGWNLVNNQWYYMNSDCKMQTGWLNLSDKWYYTDITGAMVTGWYQTSPSEIYYFYEDGSMAANTVIDGIALSETGRAQ